MCQINYVMYLHTPKLRHQGINVTPLMVSILEGFYCSEVKQWHYYLVQHHYKWQKVPLAVMFGYNFTAWIKCCEVLVKHSNKTYSRCYQSATVLANNSQSFLPLKFCTTTILTKLLHIICILISTGISWHN